VGLLKSSNVWIPTLEMTHGETHVDPSPGWRASAHAHAHTPAPPLWSGCVDEIVPRSDGCIDDGTTSVRYRLCPSWDIFLLKIGMLFELSSVLVSD